MLPPTFPRSLLIAGHGTNHHSSLFELTPFSWVTALSAVTATAVLTTYKRWWFPAVRDYGWRGVLSRYIREEDPHRAPIQERQQILQLIATDLDKKEKSLRNLEEGLQQASIHSIQGAHRRISRSVWEQYVPNLGLLSHDLDRLAAQIDQVMSAVETKVLKKELSNRVVKLMERADVLISVYKHACCADRDQ